MVYSEKSTLNKLFEGGIISDSQKDKFLAGFHVFYERSFKYGMEKLPIDDPIFENAVFVDFSKPVNVDLDNVLFFVERFDLNMEASAVNKLSEEFLDYQVIDDAEMPDSVWAEATVKVGKNADNDVKKEFNKKDVLLGYLEKLKDYNKLLRFKNLFKVAKLVLVLPHSNAGEERVFSMVRKNKTRFRASMGFNMLGSLLTVKLANPNAVSFKPDQELKKSAKKSTVE